MDTAAFDNDLLLTLLTDALRRGPGSPEWHRAVAAVRDLAGPQADEYRLLITARERLESARQYREVRAGPAFTRELFGAIDKQPTEPVRRVTPGLVVRLLCLIMLVTALGYVVMLLSQGGTHDTQQLSGRLFVTQLRSWTFGPIPKDLQVVGPLKFEAKGFGLRAGGADTDEPIAGVLYADDPLNLITGTCIEMRLDYKAGPASAQLALLQDAVIDGKLATVGRELAIVCDASGVRLDSPAGRGTPRPLGNGSHLLRLKAADGMAVAEVDGQTIWSGECGLGPRGFAAIRLVRDGRSGDMAVHTLRILAP